MINKIKEGAAKDDTYSDEDPWREYSLFSRLDWLAKSDPTCELVKTELNAVKSRNQTYTQSDHPDLHSWMSGGWVREDETPHAPESLKKLPLTPETLTELLNWKSSDKFSRTRSGLINVPSQLIGYEVVSHNR